MLHFMSLKFEKYYLKTKIKCVRGVCRHANVSVGLGDGEKNGVFIIHTKPIVQNI